MDVRCKVSSTDQSLKACDTAYRRPTAYRRKQEPCLSPEKLLDAFCEFYNVQSGEFQSPKFELVDFEPPANKAIDDVAAFRKNLLDALSEAKCVPAITLECTQESIDAFYEKKGTF